MATWFELALGEPSFGVALGEIRMLSSWNLEIEIDSSCWFLFWEIGVLAMIETDLVNSSMVPKRLRLP